MKAKLSISRDYRGDSESVNGRDSEKDRKGIQSIDRAFVILRLLESIPRPARVTELAEAAAMSTSQMHHYLVSLVKAGAVRRAGDGTYELGSFSLQLGLTALSRVDSVERATDIARLLRDDTGEAVFISLWGTHGPTIIRYFEGHRPVTIEVGAGYIMPLDTSATGHVFLTWGHAGLTPKEIAAKHKTAAIIKRTKANGFGWVDGDLLPRIAAVSAPVFNHDYRLAFAFTILGWSGELDIQPDGSVVSALKQHASMLSAELGYSPE